MAQSRVPNDPNMTKEVRGFLDSLNRQVEAITPAEIGAAGLTQVEHYSAVIALPTNKDYRIVEKLPYGFTVTSLTAKTASGTCTATLKINSTAVTGGAVSVTSSQSSSTATANNVAAAADALVLTISANASATDLSFTVAGTRTLDS